MIFIPFIYFSLLSMLIYKKHKAISVAFVISMMFTVSGFFSILLDIFKLRSIDTINYNITTEASFSYCFLLTLCLLPFILYSNTKIARISRVRDELMLRYIAWISFFWFLAVVLLSFPFFISSLSGDIHETRVEFSQGYGDNYLSYLPTIVKVPMIILTNLFSCSWILLFLAFYCKLIQKMPNRFFWLYFVASLSSIYLGALVVDRAKTTYWILSFIIMYFFFKPYMLKNQRRSILKIMYFFLAIAFLYLVFITDGRFGERDYGTVSGSQGGIISYLGQNYINFCFFFDNYNPPIIDLSLVFPFTFKFFGGQDIVNAASIQDFMTNMTGINTGVFYTFIGHLIVATSLIGAIVYCCIYVLSSYGYLHSLKKSVEISHFKAFVYLAFSSILFQGVWVYYYTTPPLTLSLFFFLIILRTVKRSRSRNIF